MLIEKNYDWHTKGLHFGVMDPVLDGPSFVHNFSSGLKWTSGAIVQQIMWTGLW